MNSDLFDIMRQHATVTRYLLLFLPVLDSFDRMLQQPGEPRWIAQAQTVREQMIEAFEEAGVQFMDVLGQPFDPDLHEAIATRADADYPNNTVCEQITRGCWWGSKVLRSAQVVVVKHEE